MDRREFLISSSSCAAALGFFESLRSLRPVTPLAVEPWARIEQIGDGVWACISTPLAAGPDVHRTFSNGGIVAGKNGVLIVEGFASNDGARWMAEIARERTGHAPTHVVLTHYHGDHSAGLGGYGTRGSRPIFVTTEPTRQKLAANRPAIAEVLVGAELVSERRVIDLGGRRVTITPRSGHTASDLTVHVDDPAVVFGGDLIWNGLFPNYVDAIPTELTPAVWSAGSNRAATIVPGHGPIPSREEFDRYKELLQFIEEAARRAHAAGKGPAETAAEVTLPPALGQWTMFSPQYFRVALEAWARVLT